MILAVLAGAATALVTAGPVAAECFGESDPWPSFRAAVPSAARIVAGEVVAPDGAGTSYLAAFELRVTHVVRGSAVGSESIEIIGLRSGLPLTVCADSVMTLLPGDVVAIAFDARAPDGSTRINTLAYLHRAGDSIMPSVEDIDLAELRALAGEADDERWDREAALVGLSVAALLAAGLIFGSGLRFVVSRRRSRPLG